MTFFPKIALIRLRNKLYTNRNASLDFVGYHYEYNILYIYKYIFIYIYYIYNFI